MAREDDLGGVGREGGQSIWSHPIQHHAGINLASFKHRSGIIQASIPHPASINLAPFWLAPAMSTISLSKQPINQSVITHTSTHTFSHTHDNPLYDSPGQSGAMARNISLLDGNLSPIEQQNATKRFCASRNEKACLLYCGLIS